MPSLPLKKETNPVRFKVLQNDLHRISRVIIAEDGWIQLERLSRDNATEEWKTRYMRLSPEMFEDVVAFVRNENQRQ